MIAFLLFSLVASALVASAVFLGLVCWRVFWALCVTLVELTNPARKHVRRSLRPWL